MAWTKEGEGSERDTQLQGEVGPGGDTLEVEDTGEVTHQSQSPYLCNGINPSFVSMNEQKHVKDPSEGLEHGTLNLCPLPVPLPLTEDPEHPGPTLDISTRKLDLLQIRGCKPVCTTGGPGMCLVSLQKAMVENQHYFFPQVFGSCTVLQFHMKIQISSSFSSLRRSSFTGLHSLKRGSLELSSCCLLYIVFILRLIFYIFFFSCITELTKIRTMIISHVPVSPLGCGQASCLLTEASAPPFREHPCPQPHVQPSAHFTCSDITFGHVCTYMHTSL